MRKPLMRMIVMRRLPMRHLLMKSVVFALSAVCLLGVLSGRVRAAAPANDAFAARIGLGSAPTVVAAGTTAGATLELGENDLDALGGASVWWKWTAPATAWVEVSTAGSAIDTVLAVMADGPTLDDAYVVGFNDESGAPDAALGSSRVVFQATAGTEYHVAVHGFLGEQGAVAVRIQSGVVPPVRVRSLVIVPGSATVTSASSSVVADVGIDTEADYVEGVMVVHRPDLSGATEIPILPAQRVSGTARSGTYRVTVPVARYSPPGTWLLEVAASDGVGREAVFGRGVSAAFEYDHVLPDGSTGFFGVVNAGAVDDQPPALAAFSRSPSAATVTSTAASLTFSFRVVDALAGFGSATLSLITPTGEALTALTVTPAQRVSGTDLDGTYSQSFTLPAGMPGGLWSVSLLLRDAAGNPAFYDGGVTGEDFPLGAASALISVTGAPHGYGAWLYPVAASAAGAGPDQDYDRDGLSNLIEYAFGFSWSLNESSLASEVLPSAMVVGGALTLEYRRRSDATDRGLLYRPQFSTTLSSSGAGGWVDAAGGVVTPGNGGWETVRVADPVAGGPRRFGRVRVQLAP